MLPLWQRKGSGKKLKPTPIYLYSDNLRIMRILLLAGGTTYLVWWGLCELTLPEAFNPLGSRLAVCALFFISWFASHHDDWARRNVAKLFYACGWVLTFHYFYLFGHNINDPNWIVGSYITVVALCACINDSTSFVAYIGFVLALSIGISAIGPQLLKTVFLTGMITILTFAYFGMRARVRLVARVISEVQKNETNLALLEMNERALRLRNEFISVASHELKTPLTTIKIQTQMARRSFKKGDPEALSAERTTQTIDLIERQADKLKELIDSMLDISRIALGRVDMKLVPCDLSAVVEDVVSNFSETLKMSGCPVNIHIAKNVMIEGDAPRIEQVVVNLLTNAVKYAEGKPVTISVAAEDNDAVLTVEDEGMGIAPEDHERIFKKFERGSTLKNISGFGLGLFVSRYIVDAHRGTIGVESELGKGSRFIVKLPKARQA